MGTSIGPKGVGIEKELSVNPLPSNVQSGGSVTPPTPQNSNIQRFKDGDDKEAIPYSPTIFISPSRRS